MAALRPMTVPPAARMARWASACEAPISARTTYEAWAPSSAAMAAVGKPSDQRGARYDRPSAPWARFRIFTADTSHSWPDSLADILSPDGRVRPCRCITFPSTPGPLAVPPAAGLQTRPGDSLSGMAPTFRLEGVFSVLPTAFHDDGALDLDGTAAWCGPTSRPGRRA